MLRIITIVFLSALMTFSDLHGQERFKEPEEEHERQRLEIPIPQPNLPQGAQVAAHEGDSLVLVAFYDSTGGPNWRDRTGWLQEPVHQWLGIRLDATGRVVSINLSGNRLVGMLPSALGQLAHLEDFHLTWAWVNGRWVYNELSGGIPPALGQLEELRSLTLNYSGLDGVIPVELTQLLSLETLNLSYNRLTGEIPPEVVEMVGLQNLRLRSNNLLSVDIPLELTQLPNLGLLDLSYNNFTGEIPAELTRLTRLYALDLSGNDLTGGIQPALGQMNLQYLRLRHNDLTGNIPPELLQLTELEDLDLGYNQLAVQIPPGLALLTKLRDLDLAGNSYTGPIPRELGQLGSLQSLNLAGNDLTGGIPPELGNLSELWRLDLSSNDLSGPIPPELGQLSNLGYLYLYVNDFSDELPKELGQLSELRTLNLSSNRLSGLIPPELGELSRLRRLYLHENDFSGPIPPELGELSQLYVFYLYDNDFSGSIPPELGKLSQLELLRLYDNDFSGSIPPELGNLSQLRQLYLHDNGFSGPIPPELGNLSQLERIYLHNNEFSGSIPPELGNLNLLWYLQLQHNEFSGVIPSELKQLDSLRWGFLHDNQFSGPLPDWTGLTRLQSAHIQANQFLFADLLPNAALSRLNDFNYAPQDTIDIQLACTNSGYAFTTSDKAEGNEYTWYRNGQSIPGAESDTLRVFSASERDVYQVTITNSDLPRLTLVSHRGSTRGAAPCTNVQYANVADSTLLVDFYNRTHGSLLWHDHTGWLEDPVVQWYGITLNASGRVTDIDLPYNNLVGQLPLSRLDQLAHLRYLNVSGNQFSGTIPEELGDLTQLEYLVLSHNKLAGSIPKELADQAPLKVLDISGNQLAGEIPTELNQITTLQTLSVSANQLSGPVPDFTGLNQLDSLHVAQNEFFFMDLLPNASLTRLDGFAYAPQDSIDTFLSRTASGFAFTTAAKAMGNRYQWYRDDQPISGPQSDTLHVSENSDPAQYHATITNDRLPALTLVSRKRGVHDGLTLTEAELPKEFLLHQSYPNPFEELTTVTFELATPEHVRIIVYDLLGQEVAKIADGPFAAGVHRIEFTGDHLASGQYLYRMEAGTYQATRFMSVVR